ncbi:PREDICTED: igLON family member 5 [Bison bison bison]|uniref:IgLON family member 5 n=1 Tax=Bison bison bison TaxID=43346 RepID=A0A6P3HTI4_BISBB|nr:PREDICTED: igLON family member 5 [Bison bison bison]
MHADSLPSFPAAPARLLYFSCSLEKTLQCSCSFRGSPMPSVRWLMGGDPVDLNSMHKNFQVTSNIAAPWANSTISLLGEPEIVRGLHCEGRNQHGIHTSSIFLIPPDKNSVSNALLKGLTQGVVYGSIATVLFLFFLVLLVMKMLKWWEESHIPKASEALIPEKPELLEEPKTPQESAAEPSPASVAVTTCRPVNRTDSDHCNQVQPQHSAETQTRRKCQCLPSANRSPRRQEEARGWRDEDGLPVEIQEVIHSFFRKRPRRPPMCQALEWGHRDGSDPGPATGPERATLPSTGLLSQSLEFSSPADNYTVCEGDNATLSCFIDEHVTRVAWLNRSNILYAGNDRWTSDPRVRLLTNTPEEFSILITQVGLGDEGLYTCSFQTRHQPYTTQVYLIVHVPARIVNISSPVTVNEGSNVNLLCLAVGRPEPTVTWRQLRDPPTITDVTSARTAVGRAALLRCEAMAVPPADFQWYKDDRLLSSGTAEGLKVQTERTRSMLLFANVSARHYGNYTCRAANRLGTSSASMRLLRPGSLENSAPRPPGPLTLLSALGWLWWRM